MGVIPSFVEYDQEGVRLVGLKRGLTEKDVVIGAITEIACAAEYSDWYLDMIIRLLEKFENRKR
ncbi:MAG: hypothetical protein QXP81_09530 [Nitrososphaerota archaeon]